MCGGTHIDRPRRTDRRGLSPRVRGNPATGTNATASDRSIPACAGEPRAVRKRRKVGAVYPRVCGGTSSPTFQYPVQGGLSPRVRGNPLKWILHIQSSGSIPACAGEPCWGQRLLICPEVYPRVCGGTTMMAPMCPPRVGLSPRVRGNPSVFTSESRISRSIPACAGEPLKRERAALYCTVYPRVCGGTA